MRWRREMGIEPKEERFTKLVEYCQTKLLPGEKPHWNKHTCPNCGARVDELDLSTEDGLQVVRFKHVRTEVQP